METLPKIPLALKDIPIQAQEMAGKMSISGVQPKIPMALNRRRGELLAQASGGEYILKPAQDRFANIPENENCCMDIAEAFEMDVPPHCLLPLTDGSLAYVIKRFDRKGKKKIHQEDFFI